ncbi:hypothetical protein V8G54_024655 [Vigna mungo]|uniref:Uncharacterized protein n=1 Tax=Vigna mungo TaxID=3915 RepID=A0AAQ3RQB6_VIGMU
MKLWYDAKIRRQRKSSDERKLKSNLETENPVREIFGKCLDSELTAVYEEVGSDLGGEKFYVSKRDNDLMAARMAALRKRDSGVFSPLMVVRGGLLGPYPSLFLFWLAMQEEVERRREGFLFRRLNGRSRGGGIAEAFVLRSKRGVAMAREDDDDVSRVTSSDDDEGEGLSIREALTVVAMGIMVVSIDSYVLAYLE